MEAFEFEFEGQKYEIVKLSYTGRHLELYKGR